MLGRSGARRSSAATATIAAGAHLLTGFPIRRSFTRTITITKCETSAGTSRLLKGILRVFAVSDLHTHHRENLTWVGKLSTTAHQQDVLIVAGDISDDLDDLRATLSVLKQRFAVVFFCPGNHELWVTGKQRRHGESSAVATAAAVPAPPPPIQSFLQAASPSADNRGEDAATGPKPVLPRPAVDLPPLAKPGATTHGAEAQLQGVDINRQALTQQPAVTQKPLTQQQPPPAPQQLPMRDSLEKLAVVMEVCKQLGVWVAPARLGRLVVVPLLAWHHKSFDTEPDIPGIPRASALTISDYARCVWPERILSELQAVRQRSEDRMMQQQQGQLQQQRENMPPACRTSTFAGAVTAHASGPGAVTEVDGGDSSGAAAALAADWRDAGHGSDAVADWLDSLNDAPYGSCGCRSSSGSSNGCAVSSSKCTDSASGDAAAGDGGGLSGGTEDHVAAQQISTEPGLLGRPSGLGGAWPSQNGRNAPQQRETAGGGLPVQCQHQRQQAPGQTAEEVLAGGEQGGACGDDLISFSHFLPLLELLPEKRYLTFPNLAKAVGSRFLEARVRRLRPHLHVFGHTHFAWDAVHDGIRFVQAPLAYPSERRFRLRSLIMAATAAAAAAEPHGRPAAGDGVREEDGSGSNEGDTGSAAAAAAVAATSAPAENAAAEATQGKLSAKRVEEPGEPPPPATAAAEATGHPPHPRDDHPRIQAALSHQSRKQNQDVDTAPDAEAAGEQHRGPAQGQGQAEGSLSSPWPSCVSEGRDVSWLPLCVYRAEYVVRLKNPDMDPQGVEENSSGGGGGLAAAVLMLRPLAEGAESTGGRSVDGAVTAATAARSGSLASACALASILAPGVEVLEWRSQWCPEQVAMWSSYYKRHPRRPHELQLAPWVAERYSRRLRRNIAKQAALGAETAPAAAPQPPSSLTSASAATGSPPGGDETNSGMSSGANGGARGGMWSGELERKAVREGDDDGDGQDCEVDGQLAGSGVRERDFKVVMIVVAGGASSSLSSGTDVEETELE